MRVVLIAETFTDAELWLGAQPFAPRGVTIVTPRSPHGARGIEATAVLSTPAASRHPRFSRLVEECLPATLWAG
jgi:hypothetical protein